MATSPSPRVRSVTTTESGWYVTDMAVHGNKLAVSGYKKGAETSYIDLFTLNSLDSSLFYKLFIHPRLPQRCVSFLGDSHIVTVHYDLVQVYHIKADDSEPLHTVNLLHDRKGWCVTVGEREVERGGKIFIGLLNSNEVIVFDFRLNESNTITLKGLKICDYPVDITVYGDNLFISTAKNHRAIRYNMEGKIAHEYTAPGYSRALSITVSGLVYILWNDLHVVVYSLSDSQQLMSFDGFCTYRIRIVDVNRLLAVISPSKVIEYSMTQQCTFENLKRTLCRVMSPIDCAELKRFFKLTDLDMSTNGNGSRDIVSGAQDDRAAHLLAILETKGFIGSDNLDGLKKAFQHLGTAHVSMLRSQLESFQLHSKPSEELSDSQSTPGQDPQIWKSLNRFSTKGKWKVVDDLAVEVSGKIIVSGRGIQDRIFVDKISTNTVREECSGETIYEGNADYSLETSCLQLRNDFSDMKHLTSIIDESRIVSCQGKTLKILNLKKNTEDPSITLDGIASCVAVRGSDILVGYKSYSPDPLFLCIDVFVSALKKTCPIKLKDLQRDVSIIDLSLLAGKLLVLTHKIDTFESDVCLFDGDGNKLLKYSPPLGKKWVGRSVAVNDTYQMVAILWLDRRNEDDTYLSFHLVDSGLCLSWAKVNQACKLRFMNSEELVLVSSKGQISSYKKTYFFSYNNLIDPIMESLASEEGWNILWQFFAVSADERTKFVEDDDDEDDYDDEDEYYSKRLAKRFMAFLHKKIVSSSQRVAALLKASWELERYHAFALSTCIDYYECLSSGSGNYNDQPYQLLHYYESSVPLGETAATQRQIQTVDDVPGTSNSSPSMPVPSQSEIRRTGPSTYYPASTNNSAPKRRTPPYSGTNVEPHNKRKNTSSSELEQENSISGNTTLQLEIFQKSNPASFQSHQQFLIPRNIQLPQHNRHWPRFNYGSTTNVSEIPSNHEPNYPSFSSRALQTSHLGGICQQSNPASFQSHQPFSITRCITPMVGNAIVAGPPQLQQSIVGNSVRPFPHTQRALPPRWRIQGLQPPNFLIQHNQGTMLPQQLNITNIPQLSTGIPNVSLNQNIDLPVRQNAPQPRHQLQSIDPLQYAQLQPPPIRGGNPLTSGVLTEAVNLLQTSQSPTTSLPMTQLEQQSPSNRQVIPSDRSDSSRQTEQFDRRLTAQVRSVHELQSGSSSDTLAGGQHLQPEPTISGEPSSSQVGGPSTDRPRREADRSVIIGESRMVVQESSVEPELTAQEDYDSSAPSAWRSGSTSGDINYYPASTDNSAPKRRAPPYAGTNVEPHNKRKPPDVLTQLHERLQKVFAEMTRSDRENLANFLMFPLKDVKAIINSPSHSEDLLVEVENKGIIQSALTDELCEKFGALNIVTGRNWKPPDIMKITSSISGKGGFLQFPNTGIKLVFPPNAVTKEHNIQAKIIPPSLSYGADTILSSNSSVVLQLLPNGLQLKREISLTLPHCLTFINEEKAKAKIYVSHHEEGQRPRWEERPLIPYIFHRSKCTVRLLGFCWLKVIIDDTEVEAKNLVVFAAKMIRQNKQTAKVEVGYYENIPERGEPNILKLNPGLKPELCLQLKFMKEGKQPLTISFNGTDPDDTWYIKQGKAKQEISWQSIALYEERLVPFVLQRRKNMDSFCNFSVQQGNHNPIKFEIGLEVDLSTVEIFDSKVPDSILNELARKLTEEWQMLARELNISQFDLYNIKENNTGNIVNTKYLMLSHWSKMNGTGATCRVLAEALQKVNRRDLKEFVEKEVTMQGRNETTQDS